MAEDIVHYCVIAVVLIVAEVTLAPALLFGAPYAGIALNSYVVLGLGLTFIGMISFRLNQDEGRLLLEKLGGVRISNSGAFKRFRAQLYSYMFLVTAIICWPAKELNSFRLMSWKVRQPDSSQGLSASLNLFPVEVSESLFVAVAPAILTVIAAHRQPPFIFSLKFLWLIIFAIFLKHLSALISGDTVQAKLRRGIDPVPLSYAVITVSDLLGLILCYNAVSNWNTGSAFRLTNAQLIIAQLLAFKDFKDFIRVYEHPPDSILAYFVGVSGLLWWLSLAQGLLHIKGYQRGPSDYLSLASSCILLGKEDRARILVEAAEVSTKLECENKGSIYAALGDFDKAAVFIKRALTQTDDVPVTDSYILIKMAFALTYFRADQNRYYTFLEYGMAHGMSDIFLCERGTGLL